jgi:hypothetical protein
MYMRINKVLCEGKMTVNNQNEARRNDLDKEEIQEALELTRPTKAQRVFEFHTKIQGE